MAKDKVREGDLSGSVSRNKFGEWCWSLDVHHGEMYDPDFGERCIEEGEEVADIDLVWRVHKHGYARTEKEAWQALAAAAQDYARRAVKVADYAISKMK